MSRATIWAVAAVTMLTLVIAGAAHPSNGTGTEGFCERHGCGAPEDPGGVTECPTLSCPEVTCEATDCSKTTVVVNPTPVTCPTLPTVTFPRYYPCRENKDGTYTCPRKRTPHRAFLPETDPASGK